MRAALAVATGLLLASLLAVAGCQIGALDRWERARRQDVDPLNAALHRHLPAEIKGRDVPAILAHYETAEGGGLTFDGPVRAPDRASERRLRWKQTGTE